MCPGVSGSCAHLPCGTRNHSRDGRRTELSGPSRVIVDLEAVS